MSDIANIQNLSNSKIFTNSQYYSAFWGSFELHGKGKFLKVYIKGVFQAEKKKKIIPWRGISILKRKVMQNNIEKRETLRLNLNNNKFTPINI